MNFEQAVIQMTFGSHVRLSDWMGYWFIDGASSIPIKENSDGSATYDRMDISAHLQSIRVFTRDGDILDSPNIDRYKDRDDWEVVTQIGWSFDMALRFMKNGKSVKRISWHENSYTLSLDPLLNRFLANGETHVLAITVGEILAKDWQIVE